MAAGGSQRLLEKRMDIYLCWEFSGVSPMQIGMVRGGSVIKNGDDIYSTINGLTYSVSTNKLSYNGQKMYA